MLNELFARFDRVVARHGLEKIKTIGDCYMVAFGAMPSISPAAWRAMASRVKYRSLRR
jgi:adenylate cyclase